MNARLILAIGALVALPAVAQPAPSATIEQRQANQDARIQQGVQSGQLTNKEAAKLQVGQDKVQGKVDKARADGVVTPKERAKIAKAQNKQSKKIAKQKHDRQKKAHAT